MDELTDSAKNTFQGETIRDKVRKIIEKTLQDEKYDENKVPFWINRICEECMDELHAPRKPFKYMVSCAIMQRTGNSIQSSTSCFWDTSTDESIFEVWPNRDSIKNIHSNYPMVCIVTVFAASFVVGL